MSYPTFLPVFAFSDRYTVQHPDEQSENQADCLVVDTFSGDVCVMQKVVAVSKTQAVIYCQQLKKLLSLSQPQVEQTSDCFVSDRSVVVVKKPVVGQLFSDIATERGQFTEPEVVLLQQVLAILSVLHQNGIRHCNLSPDTICLRIADGKPILTQFGFFRDDVVDVRVNRSPALQSQAFCLTGITMPRDDREDFYSLAALMAIMLLTGQPLTALFNSQAGRWSWEAACSVGQDMCRILNRMLSSYESDWFTSADEFLFALSLVKAEAATLQTPPVLPPPALPDADAPLCAEYEQLPPPVLPVSQLSPLLWSQKDGIEIVQVGMMF